MRQRERLSPQPTPRLRGSHVGSGSSRSTASGSPPARQRQRSARVDSAPVDSDEPGVEGHAATLPGRGTPENPANRFERLAYEIDDEANARASVADREAEEGGEEGGDASSPASDAPPTPRKPETLYLRDPARKIIAHNQSPDVPFEASINPYRGCEHGCIYCYARPSHEYLGFSAGLDFETRIMVKDRAPELLRKELSAKRWVPQTIALSGVTDPYQPIERHLELTRRCLRVLADFRNPVGIITKNALVARDLDLLEELAEHRAVSVGVSVTTLDRDLHRTMEPRASAPHERLRAIERLARSRVPVHVMVSPIIPGLTDHEIPKILESAAAAGAQRASYIVVRLPHAVAPLFDDWLARHYPDRARKVLGRIRALRDGRLNDPRFSSRMRGEGIFAEQIGQLFRVAARRYGLDREAEPLSCASFRRPGDGQLDLFGQPQEE